MFAPMQRRLLVHIGPGARVLAMLALPAMMAIAPPAPAAAEEPARDKGPGQQAGQVPSGDLPKPLVIPESEKKRQNPVPDVPEAIEAGKALYSSQCAMCHGARGDGRGDVAVGMKLRMPSFADPKVQAKRTDGEWFYIMSQGHGDMPGEKRLVDQNKWEIVRYLRTLARPPAPAPAK
jgi:mono/diheme cytochrome c family protein